MLLCDISNDGSLAAFPHTIGAIVRGGILCLLALLLALLAGCGYKIVSVAETDKYCFACQTSGFAQCTDKGKPKEQPLTEEEAEKILSVIKVKEVNTRLKPGEERFVPAAIRIDGYKKY